MRKLKSAHSPVFADAGHQMIDLMVLFHELEHLGHLPFTAHHTDPHDHGKDLYTRAMRGEFGLIKPFTEHPSYPGNKKSK